MKCAVLSVLLLFVFVCNAFASASWETGEMPYTPSLSGSVCWTTMRKFKDERPCEAMFHSMDLSTGEIQTRGMNDWYIIATDLSQNGTLVARQNGGLLEIAQYSSNGSWEPFLKYPYDNSYTSWDASTTMNYNRSVMAYLNGCIYYVVSDDAHEWIRCEDINGNIHDYQTGYLLTQISPNGNIDGVDGDNNRVIETMDGSVFVIGRNASWENRRYFPVAWLDDERLLMWVRKLDNGSAQYLYEYQYQDDQFTQVYNENGEPVLCVDGSDGYTSSYNPLNQQIAQLVYWAEDYFSVPTILNSATGLPVFIAETEHTDTYDDYCTSSDRITWLIPG